MISYTASTSKLINLKLSWVYLCCNTVTEAITHLASAVCNWPGLVRCGYVALKFYISVFLDYKQITIIVPPNSCAILCMSMPPLKIIEYYTILLSIKFYLIVTK